MAARSLAELFLIALTPSAADLCVGRFFVAPTYFSPRLRSRAEECKAFLPSEEGWGRGKNVAQLRNI